MDGCWVAFLMPSHPCTGPGAARRRGPTGGWAKGIPRYCSTIFSEPLTFTYCPRTLPCFRTTTGPESVQQTEICNTHSLIHIINYFIFNNPSKITKIDNWVKRYFTCIMFNIIQKSNIILACLYRSCPSRCQGQAQAEQNFFYHSCSFVKTDTDSSLSCNEELTKSITHTSSITKHWP